MPRSRYRQRGAAIVTAMLVVVLTTTIVAGLFYRTNVTVRSVENRLAIAQTHWIERGVIDWARVVLQVDGMTNAKSDNLGEAWATPILDTQLDETVTAGAKIGDASKSAMLAGQVYDGQARFNLNNLIDDPNDLALNALQKLLELAGQPTSMAQVLRARIQQSYTRTVKDQQVKATALPLLKVTDLRFVPGFTGDVITAIEPYVIFLPLNPTTTVGSNGAPSITRTMSTINVNTADAIVLAAVIPKLDLDTARRFTSQTLRQYQTVELAVSSLSQGLTAPSGMLSVVSSYFLVRGVVRYDRVEDQTDTLLYRQGNRVDIVWQQRS